MDNRTQTVNDRQENLYSESQFRQDYPQEHLTIVREIISQDNQVNWHQLYDNQLYREKFKKEFPDFYSVFLQNSDQLKPCYWQTHYTNMIIVKGLLSEVKLENFSELFKKNDFGMSFFDYVVLFNNNDIFNKVYETINEQGTEKAELASYVSPFLFFLKEKFSSNNGWNRYLLPESLSYQHNYYIYSLLNQFQYKLPLELDVDNKINDLHIIDKINNNFYPYLNINLEHLNRHGDLNASDFIYQDNPLSVSARLHYVQLFHYSLQYYETLIFTLEDEVIKEFIYRDENAIEVEEPSEDDDSSDKENKEKKEKKEKDIKILDVIIDIYKSAVISAIYGKNIFALQALWKLPLIEEKLTTKKNNYFIQQHLVYSLLNLQPFETVAQISTLDQDFLACFFSKTTFGGLSIHDFFSTFIRISARENFTNKYFIVSHLIHCFINFGLNLDDKNANKYFKEAFFYNNIEVAYFLFVTCKDNLILNYKKNYNINFEKRVFLDFPLQNTANIQLALLNFNQSQKDFINFCINSLIYQYIKNEIILIAGESYFFYSYEIAYQFDLRVGVYQQLLDCLNDQPLLYFLSQLKNWFNQNGTVQEAFSSYPNDIDVLLNEFSNIERKIYDLYCCSLPLAQLAEFRKSCVNRHPIAIEVHDVPKEIWLKILSCVPINDLVGCIFLINKTFNILGRDNTIWFQKLKDFYFFSALRKKPVKENNRFYFSEFQLYSKAFFLNLDKNQGMLLKMLLNGRSIYEMNYFFYNAQGEISCEGIRKELIKIFPSLSEVITEEDLDPKIFFSKDTFLKINNHFRNSNQIKKILGNKTLLIAAYFSPLQKNLSAMLIEDFDGKTFIDWAILTKNQLLLDIIFILILKEIINHKSGQLNIALEEDIILPVINQSQILIEKKKNYNFKFNGRYLVPRKFLFWAVECNQIAFLSNSIKAGIEYEFFVKTAEVGSRPAYNHTVLSRYNNITIEFKPEENIFLIAALNGHNDLLKLFLQRFKFRDTNLKLIIYLSTLQAVIYGNNHEGLKIILTQPDFVKTIFMPFASTIGFIFNFFHQIWKVNNELGERDVSIFDECLKICKEKNLLHFVIENIINALTNGLPSIQSVVGASVENLKEHPFFLFSKKVFEKFNHYADVTIREYLLISLNFTNKKYEFLELFNLNKDIAFSNVAMNGLTIMSSALFHGDIHVFHDVFQKIKTFPQECYILQGGFILQRKIPLFFYDYNETMTSNIYKKYIPISIPLVDLHKLQPCMFNYDILIILAKEMGYIFYHENFYKDYAEYRQAFLGNTKSLSEYFITHHGSTIELFKLCFLLETHIQDYPEKIYQQWLASDAAQTFKKDRFDIFSFIENVIERSKTLLNYSNTLTSSAVVSMDTDTAFEPSPEAYRAGVHEKGMFSSNLASNSSATNLSQLQSISSELDNTSSHSKKRKKSDNANQLSDEEGNTDKNSLEPPFKKPKH